MLPILTSYSKGQGRKGAIKYGQSDIKISIKQDSSRSKFSVTEDGFYFVSLSASTEHFGNEGVHLKIDKVSTSGEESHLVSPMLDHEAESENGYSGGGVVTGVALPFLKQGDSVLTLLDNDLLDGSRVTEAQITIFKLPDQTKYIECTKEREQTAMGLITFDNGCRSRSFAVKQNSSFTVLEGGNYLLCLEAEVERGGYFRSCLLRLKPSKLVYTSIESKHTKLDQDYAGEGTVVNCRVTNIPQNHELTAHITANTGSKMKWARFIMFGLSSHYLSAFNIEKQDQIGPVTFKACEQSGIDEHCRKMRDFRSNSFTVTYSGKYYLSLSAFTGHVNGGLVKLAVMKNGQTTLLTLENDHEDHQSSSGFSGGGTVFRDAIRELSQGDKIEVLVTEVQQPSMLTQCKINMFFLD